MTPAEFTRRLDILVGDSSIERVRHAIGGAAKKAARDAAGADVGRDLRMSNMRTKARLSAGYDIEGQAVVLHLRPAGLWTLADSGRRRSGFINPRGRRVRGVRRAVMTPKGPRAHSRYGPSRGLGTINDTMRTIAIECPKAADRELTKLLGAL